MPKTAARSSGLPAATPSGTDRLESPVNSAGAAMCCSHIPSLPTRCRRNASWWLTTAVSTARISGSPILGSRRRISGTRQRPVSRNPRSRKYVTLGGTAGFACASGASPTRWTRTTRRRRPSARPGSGIRRDPAA